MRPGFSAVRGFINAVADREIGALQSLAAANVNDARVRRSHRDRTDRLSRLAIENGLPRLAVVRSLPYSAIYLSHEEDIRFRRNAGYRDGAPSTKRADAPPPQALVQLRAEFLRHSRGSKGDRKEYCDKSGKSSKSVPMSHETHQAAS